MKSTFFCHLFVTFLVMLGSPGAVGQEISSPFGMVASDNPLASQMGAKVLEDGGNAVDAGVVTLLTLGLVNPFASGLGGGGFCLHQPLDGEATVLDFRETAPARAHRDLYIVDGEPSIELMLRGGLASGTPGEVAGLWAIHSRLGKLPWKDLVMRVEKLAREGHSVGELLERRLRWRPERLDEYPELKAAYTVNKDLVKKGDTLKNPAMGRLLKRIANEGPSAFYEGEIAQAIVRKVKEHGGILELEDLKDYKVVWRTPVRGTYRGYEIIGMPPPSSGGIATIQTLNILEAYDLRTLGQSSVGLHLIVEALKHAFADRARYLGDGDFVNVPVERLISKEHASKQRKMIRPWETRPDDLYGDQAPPPDNEGTSHLSVADRDGSMLACTSTINTIFGSMVHIPEAGFVMNNEMADFTAQPGLANNYGLVGNEQNAVAGRKRPLSSMTPTIIRKDGVPMLAIGGSGGPTIITGTIFGILRVLDFGLSPQESIVTPRSHHQWMPNKLFIEEITDAERAVLARMGHDIEVRPGFTAVQMVLKRGNEFVGASDPRKLGAPAAPKR